MAPYTRAIPTLHATADLDQADPIVRHEPDGLQLDRGDPVGHHTKRVEGRSRVGLVRVGQYTVDVDLLDGHV